MSNQHLFQFTGTTAQYFKLWLKNLLLTLITFGFYGPWARVKRERFFMTHTQVGGSSFDFTADPVKILFGRFVLVVIILLSSFVIGLIPFKNPLMFIVLALLYPWIIISAMRMRARYTYYRGLHFRFSGIYKSALKAIIGWKILAACTFFFPLWPLAKYKERSFLVNSLKFGASSFQHQFRARSFYRPYIWAFLFGAVLFLMLIADFKVVAEELRFLHGGDKKALVQAFVPEMLRLSLFYILPFYLLVIPALKFALARLTWNKTKIGDFEIQFAPSFFEYLALTATNLIMFVLSFGLAAPYIAVRMHKFKIDNLQLHGLSSLDQFVAERQSEVDALGDQISEAYDLEVDLGF